MHDVQASWVTVREALRQLHGEHESINSGHVLQLAQLCPMLLSTGDKQPLHMTWAGRSAPDAAEVVAKAAQHDPCHSCSPSAASLRPGAVQQCTSNQNAGAGSAIENMSLLARDDLDMVASRNVGPPQNQRLGCFLIEPTASERCHAGPSTVAASSHSSPTQQRRERVELAGVDTHTTAFWDNGTGAEQLCSQTEDDDQTRQAQVMNEGRNFEIHLADPPRHVPSPISKAANASSKRKGRQSKTRKSSSQAAPQDCQTHIEECAMPEDAAEKDEEDVIRNGEAGEYGADAFEHEMPAFTSGSRALRHSAAFQRCVVQALALLQEARIPDDSNRVLLTIMFLEFPCTFVMGGEIQVHLIPVSG
jgi:hypothetical protein